MAVASRLRFALALVLDTARVVAESCWNASVAIVTSLRLIARLVAVASAASAGATLLLVSAREVTSAARLATGSTELRARALACADA